MAFTATELIELESMLDAGESGPAFVTKFRTQFPGRSLTRCDASDMGAEEPYKQLTYLDMYLVDGNNHCWNITHDPAVATGIVLARHRRPA
jgi:hypothetical protein